MKFVKSVVVVGTAVLAAGMFSVGPAQAERVPECDNSAWKPYKPAWNVVAGDGKREGNLCGNASVVVNVYRETGWSDELIASREQTFATGVLTATSEPLWVSCESFYTQIRLNGETKAQSDTVRLC
ncbi:hypothetical protein [Nocardia brasiliensis]|uniref:hypothetical protein n=1 Tax=Nocardia brasiliensis TaxID=37326 RepID=UPI003671ECC9